MGSTLKAILKEIGRCLKRLKHIPTELGFQKPPKVKGEWDQFYKAFELNFRGSQEDVERKITSRYQSVLEKQNNSKSKKPKKPKKLLDLGCGHGEMLGLANDNGYLTLGIDQSVEAVNQCIRLGHQAIKGDILTTIAKKSRNSYQVVTLLHVIEHCEKDFVLLLFKEVFRILEPGGIFIVETPSVYSLWAGHRQFYLDPTHLRPVHPEYIKFMAGYSGFSHCDILTFGEVEHPNRPNLASCINDSPNPLVKRIEIDKIEQWLYGDMDVCCIIKK